MATAPPLDKVYKTSEPDSATPIHRCRLSPFAIPIQAADFLLDVSLDIHRGDQFGLVVCRQKLMSFCQSGFRCKADMDRAVQMPRGVFSARRFRRLSAASSASAQNSGGRPNDRPGGTQTDNVRLLLCLYFDHKRKGHSQHKPDRDFCRRDKVEQP